MNLPVPNEAPIIWLRPAEAADYEIARRIHHAGMRWIGERLYGVWDHAVQDARFKQKFVPTEVCIIVADGEDAGYLQATVVADDVVLKELHIDEAFQNRGIGTKVLRALLVEAHRIAKAVTVSVVKFNPALAFYERAGFRVVSDMDEHRFLLRHDVQ